MRLTHKINFLFLFLFSFFTSLEQALANEVFIGTGLSSVTQGRYSPTFYGAYEYDDNAITFNSVGSASEYYYNTVLNLNYFLNKDFGEIGHSKIHAGLGLSIIQSEVGYREDKDDEKGTVVYDTNVGAGIRVRLDILDNFFFGVEGIYGVKGLMPVLLTFQSTQFINFGVRF